MKRWLIGMLFFLTACGPSQGQIQTAIAQTQAALPTATLPPTLAPSNTPKPTNTPVPPTSTPTPRPTATPAPTETATVEPTPIVLTGKGDAVVDIQKNADAEIVHITGNKGRRFFSVENLDADNQTLDLLVDTTDVYDGVRPLDFDGRQTVRFKVQAVGAWQIEVKPVTQARRLDAPGEIKGNGDDVIAVCCKTLDTALIAGNQKARFFSVEAFYEDGQDLLVDTTDTYGGTVLLHPKDAAFLVIQAVGEWVIDVSTK